MGIGLATQSTNAATNNANDVWETGVIPAGNGIK